MSGYDITYTGMIAVLNGNGGSIPIDPPMPHDAERVVMTRDYCGAYTYRNGTIERIMMGNGFIQDSVYYVQIKDYQGNVRTVIDRNRNIVEHNEYYPYGGLINASDSQLQPYKYSSKELDRENGLDLYDSQARWYDPMFPQTTTQDPLAEKYQSISPYTWCSGNPVKYFDPNGLDWVMSNKDQSIKWFDNVTSSKQTPIGYKYIGKSDNDILSMLYLNINFSNIVSNNIGYIAQDINVGFNMANIKEESIAFITADITRDATKGRKNNINGNYFNGVIINIIENTVHTPIVETLHSASEVEVSYGHNLYQRTLRKPLHPYFTMTNTESKEASVFIPAKDSSINKKLNYIRVKGNWSIETGHGSTMFIHHPFFPLAKKINHSWIIKKRKP